MESRFAILAALLLMGCVQSPPHADAAPDVTIHNATTNVSAPPRSIANSSDVTVKQKFDKFSLWNNGTRLRGANIYQRIVYPGVYDDPEVWGNGPLGPVFTQNDFDALSSAGANLVVLSHPGLYDDRPPYAFNKDAQDNLDNYIEMARKADLFVVIAFRTGPGRSEFTFFGVANDTFGQSHLDDQVWKDRSAQEKWVDMWRYTAARYRNSSNVVGYELMVEPNSNGVWLDIYEPADFYSAYGNTTYDWGQLYPKISSAIREVDDQTPILIGGMSWSGVKWLPYLKPTGDNRTVYIIHQYEPQDQYTHQEYSTKMNTYPGRFDISGNGTLENFDSAWIDNELSPVDRFKSDFGAPVAATEFGAIRWVPGAGKFLDDEMAAFEERGLNFAVWSWQPASEKYNQAQNDFNFRMGPDPANLTEGNSGLYDALKRHWTKNTLRPSDIGNAS